MASLVNAARNILSDNWWFVKLVVLTLPVYLILSNEQMSETILNQNIPVLIVLLLIYLGCASVMMNRNINNKSPILPGIFTIPEVIVRAIGSFIVGLPGMAVLTAACYFVSTNIVLEEPIANLIVYICIVSFISPFIFVPMVLLSVNGKITDAMRINKITEAAGNFIVAFLAFLIQYAFMILLLTWVLYKLLYEMMGEGNIAILILVSFVSVFSFFLIFSYASDLYEDVIPPIKSKRDIL